MRATERRIERLEESQARGAAIPLASFHAGGIVKIGQQVMTVEEYNRDHKEAREAKARLIFERTGKRPITRLIWGTVQP